jgi:hypothetical protein
MTMMVPRSDISRMSNISPFVYNMVDYLSKHPIEIINVKFGIEYDAAIGEYLNADIIKEYLMAYEFREYRPIAYHYHYNHHGSNSDILHVKYEQL